MSKVSKIAESSNPRVSAVEMTKETLSSRGGLVLFSKYLTTIGVVEVLAQEFGFLRKSCKGLRLTELFKQILCFFFDGTALCMSRFDQLQKDEGYSGVIESRQA